MEVSLQKLVLLAAVAAVVATIVVALRPWETLVAYRVEYLRKKAIEIAVDSVLLALAVGKSAEWRIGGSLRDLLAVSTILLTFLLLRV